MILAILCTIWAVVLTFSLVASLPELNESEGWSSILLVIFVAILPTIVLWGLYWFLKVKVFEISFAGGKIAFKASSYNENEVNNFQRALRQAKDNYKEAPNTVSNSSGADELKKYKDLLDSGVISQADFDIAKKKILG